MDATPRRDAFSVLTSSAKRKRPNIQDAGQVQMLATFRVCSVSKFNESAVAPVGIFVQDLSCV